MTWTFSKFLLLLVLILGASSCRTTNSRSMRANTNELKEETNIIFVNLKISRDSAQREVVELVSATRAKGKLKNANENTREPADKLVCHFLDSEEKIIQIVTVQNPLKAALEQYSTDGTIQRRDATLTSAYFTIRAEVSSTAVTLRVSNSNGQRISLLKL